MVWSFDVGQIAKLVHSLTSKTNRNGTLVLLVTILCFVTALQNSRLWSATLLMSPQQDNSLYVFVWKGFVGGLVF